MRGTFVRRRRRRRDQRGFTLIELAVIVAIIGVLAGIAIPNWASTARNKKYDPEITAMFTEISTREEQYKAEQGNGLYLDAAQCPSAPNPSGIDFNATCVIGTSAWVTMHVTPTDSSIRCTYQVTTGASGVQPTPPPVCGTVPVSLVGPWYYDLATCDMDGNGGVNATFCMSSWDTAQRKLNYGQ